MKRRRGLDLDAVFEAASTTPTGATADEWLRETIVARPSPTAPPRDASGRFAHLGPSDFAAPDEESYELNLARERERLAELRSIARDNARR